MNQLPASKGWLDKNSSPPKSEPKPPPPCSEWVCSGRVGPSDGWMRTQPGPSKATWKVSPLPRPIKVLKEISERTLVRTLPLHAIADSGSAKVGVLVSSSTGSPCEVTATLPVPSSTTLKRPPASLPAPLTRRMSQSTSPSKARIESPLTVIRSFRRSMIIILRASWARKRSPVPVADISLTPSPVKALLKKRPRPPLVLKAYLALVGDHRAELRLNSVVLQPHLQKRRVLQREPADRGLPPGTARGSSRSPLYLLVGCTIGYHPDSRLQPDSRLIRWLSTLAVAPITKS